MVRIAISGVVGVMLTLVAVAAQQATAPRVVAPASYVSGPMPALPVMALGGGEVLVELTVSDRGAVVAVRTLRETVPFTALVVDAVRTWRFSPAEELLDPSARKPGEPPTRSIESKVVVAALFRPPSAYVGATLGEPGTDVQSPSDESPFPISMIVPTLLPLAYDPGVVMTEARVDRTGTVTEAKVKNSWPPFDGAALDAARQWKFRPARAGGASATSRAYLIFGFRRPDATGAQLR